MAKRQKTGGAPPPPPPYVPWAHGLTYKRPVSDVAAAYSAIAGASTLSAALRAYGPRDPAVLLGCLWEPWHVPDPAAAARILLNPDRHRCSPWLWLFQDGAAGPVLVPSVAPSPTSVWFLVQTPEQKRVLLYAPAGRVEAAYRVRATGLARDTRFNGQHTRLEAVTPKKTVLYVNAVAMAVVEAAGVPPGVRSSHSSTQPSVPSVYGLALSRESRSGFAKPGAS